MKKKLLSAFRLLAILFLLVVLTLSLAGYVGTLHRYFELASHFKPQYLIASIVCLAVLLPLRARWWAIAACGCVLLNAVPVMVWYFPFSHPAASAPDLRLLQANVNAGNTNYQAFLDLVETEAPDVIVVQEAGEAWVQALATLNQTYPYKQFASNRDNAGILLLSRFPFEKATSEFAQSFRFPICVISLNIKGVSVSLVSIHPPPPIRDKFFYQRNTQLAKVAELVKQLPKPAIVIGDLNTSLWSPYFSRFVCQTELVNARQGFGILPTYPAYNRLMSIPIDHCLVSNDLRVTDCRVGNAGGSDHLPLLVDLEFARQGNISLAQCQ